MNSGIYIRVGKESKLLEELTKDELYDWLNILDNDALKRTIEILSHCLKLYEDNSRD